MNQNTQIELIERALACVENKTTHMIDKTTRLPVERYCSQEIFEREKAVLFKRYPIIVAHSSQIAKPGDYICHEESGSQIIAIRSESGKLNAFLNVCRHRGTKLVWDEKGCNKRAFVCPYHGWTYNQDGKLINIPHQEGFPDLDCNDFGLVPLAVEEGCGFVWVNPSPGGNIDLKSYLGGLGEDLESFSFASHIVYKPGRMRKALNWKLAIDIFLEAYHVRLAHRNSIAPIFFDNIGLHDPFHPHSRNVFPKRKIVELRSADKKDWNIRPYANILYYIFPNTLILVEPDHAASVAVFPDGADGSILLTSNMIPEAPTTEKAIKYWDKNIDILMNAVAEDLAMGESIQKGIGSGANEFFNFGRFEQSLQYFHKAVSFVAENTAVTEN